MLGVVTIGVMESPGKGHEEILGSKILKDKNAGSFLLMIAGSASEEKDYERKIIETLVADIMN
jgi:hypothetical protein